MTTVSDLAVIDRFVDDYRFLSNFWIGEPVVYHQLYLSAEHMYQALKTADPHESAWIASAPTPGEAKRRGATAQLRPGWEGELRFEVMRKTIGAKFLRDWHLQKALLATGTALLIEGNTWHDQTWGNCTCGRDACAAEGENWLGRLLMEMREDLRKWS
jgi:hypothetical protein